MNTHAKVLQGAEHRRIHRRPCRERPGIQRGHQRGSDGGSLGRDPQPLRALGPHLLCLGVIYLLLVLFSVGQARGLFTRGAEAPEATRRIGLLFVLSSAANVAWLLLWHSRLIALSQAAMLVLLGSLIAIYLRLGTGSRRAGAAERLIFRLPSASTSAGSRGHRSRIQQRFS
ncbi:MAG: hypothetical protein MZU91_14370 [Desulfosudis oleivorans]|nr:hypothetical protein [Desulfosudis oleivorans]